MRSRNIKYKRSVVLSKISLFFGCAFILSTSPMAVFAEPVSNTGHTPQFQIHEPSRALSINSLKSTEGSNGSLGSVSAADTVTVTCNFQANDPHNSTHNPGQVNVVGTATCDYPMDNIWLDMGLYYEGVEYGYGESYDNYGKTNAQVTADYGCMNGSWTGIMNWYLQPPSNVTSLTPTEGTVTSNTVVIEC